MTNVKDFGAAGDGRTDDIDSIQHAIEQGDGHVVFPRGVYRITRPIEVELKARGRTGIDGEAGTAKLVMDAPGPAIRFVGTHDRTAQPSDFRPGVWELERMPTVSSIEIVGAHNESDGVELEGTMQATISGVLIRRCRYGVHLVKRNRNLLVANSHIYHGRGSAIGIYFDGVNLHQSNIVGCHISYCTHAGIKIERSEIRNLQITGNDIEYNFEDGVEDSADVWIDSREGTVREGTIASNTIQAKNSPRGANVRIEGLDNELANKAGLWTVSGNVIQSQAVNLWLRSCRGVVVAGNSFCSGFERSIVLENCRHVLVGSNTFDHNPDYSGDRIDGITIRNSAGCTLSNLILESTRAGGPDSGGAIEVFDSREIAITGCQVLDPESRGIYLSNASNSRVSDCTILDRRAAVKMLEALRITGFGRGNLVTANLFGRGSRGDLHVAPATAVVQDNHTITPE
jgi:parallel beta-helix repeat protein